MSTSGWQNSQWIYYLDGMDIIGNVSVDGITHSGNTLRVQGTISIGARRVTGSGISVYFNAGIYAAAPNQADGQILGNFENLYVDQDHYRSFDVTIDNVSASSTSYSFGVRYHSEYFDTTLYWTINFAASGTPPTGLTATLGTVGPDWAEIAISISSYGSPSTSANRYIEAAVLGSSTYGSPYRYKKQTAVTSNTFIVDNSGSGSLTIVPNTQYRYGGYATNTVVDTSTVAGTFVTLPAKPTLTAIDQGHGQIDFTVSHATEGSAKTVTEEYSTDGGTTWTTITGGAFTLVLATQTEVIVRRISDAGESSETVTVTPTFTCGVYVSVVNKTAAAKKAYVPVEGKKIGSISFATSGRYLESIDSDTFKEWFNSLPRDIAHPLLSPRNMFDRFGEITGIEVKTNYTISILFPNSYYYYYNVSPSDWDTQLATMGITTVTGHSLINDSATATSTAEENYNSRKVKKIYASVNGKTTLVFEDAS